MTKDKYESLKREGICVSCRVAKAEKGKTKCQECADKDRKRSADTRKFYKQLGFCPRCKVNPLFGDENTCPECLAKASESRKTDKEYNKNYHKIRYTERKSNGLCVACGEKAIEGKIYCLRCTNKRKSQKARYRRNKGIEERAERFYLGQCYICGNKVDNGNKLCPKCKQRAINNLKPADNTNHMWKSENKLIRSKNYGEKMPVP